MQIHWFPGHMTKALRMMAGEMPLVDCVIYVLDARAPLSTVNTAFDSVIGQKPILYVLNKSDLSDRKKLTEWQEFFTSEKSECIIANSLSGADSYRITDSLMRINAPLIERYRQKGVKKTVRAMVIGMPNTGKSTLINSLAKEKRAATGNKPGITRGKQWVTLSPYIELLDSPGVLYPDFKDQKKAVNLALIGCIKEEITDTVELASECVKILTRLSPAPLSERYKLETLDDSPLEVLEKAAHARGMLRKGGEPDIEKAASAVIIDYRKGLLGKIILDELKTNA